MLLSVKPRFGSHLSKLSVCESPGADVSRHNEAKLTFVTMLASQTLPPEVTDRHAFRYPTKALDNLPFGRLARGPIWLVASNQIMSLVLGQRQARETVNPECSGSNIGSPSWRSCFLPRCRICQRRWQCRFSDYRQRQLSQSQADAALACAAAPSIDVTPTITSATAAVPAMRTISVRSAAGFAGGAALIWPAILMEFAGLRATERRSSRVPGSAALCELNKGCVNSRRRSETRVVRGRGYPALTAPLCSSFGWKPVENARMTPFLAAIRWFPLGQLIAPQSNRRIAVGAGYIATSARRRSRSQKAIRRGRERRMEPLCIW